MKSCPICHREGTLLLVATSGFWERQVLARLGWNPYRCRVCGHRIVRMGRGRGGQPRGRERTSAGRRHPASSSPAAATPDGSDFHQLIQQLARAEAACGLTTAPSSGDEPDAGPPRNVNANGSDEPGPRAG